MLRSKSVLHIELDAWFNNEMVDRLLLSYILLGLWQAASIRRVYCRLGGFRTTAQGRAHSANIAYMSLN